MDACAQVVRGRDVPPARRVAAQAGRQGGLLRRAQLLYQGHVYALAIYQSVSSNCFTLLFIKKMQDFLTNAMFFLIPVSAVNICLKLVEIK